jgi:hypothetical protein
VMLTKCDSKEVFCSPLCLCTQALRIRKNPSVKKIFLILKSQKEYKPKFRAKA